MPTPLIYAFEKIEDEDVLLSVTRLLINFGADLSTEDDDGYTPLMCASRFGYDEVVQILEQAGAKW